MQQFTDILIFRRSGKIAFEQISWDARRKPRKWKNKQKLHKDKSFLLEVTISLMCKQLQGLSIFFYREKKWFLEQKKGRTKERNSKSTKKKRELEHDFSISIAVNNLQ